MEKKNIKAIADTVFASMVAEFRSDFDDGFLDRIADRYFSSSKGMLMFEVWARYISARNQDVISGKGCGIEEFMVLMQSRGHSAECNCENGSWSVLVGKTRFEIRLSREGEGRCIIYARTPEFKWAGGMYDDSVLDTSLTDVTTLIERIEEFDALNPEIIDRFDREAAYWKKMLLARRIETVTDEARKHLL